MKYLFIGGPADGEWCVTEGPGRSDIVNVRSTQPLVAKSFDDPIEFFPSMPKGHETTRYRIRGWSASDHVIYIYTPDGVSDFDTVQQLLKGYKP